MHESVQELALFSKQTPPYLKACPPTYVSCHYENYCNKHDELCIFLAMINEEIKNWLEMILDTEWLTCNLFVTSSDFWSDPRFELKVKNFIQYLGEDLWSKVQNMNITRCELVQESKTKEFCKCFEAGSRSWVCDPFGRCPCKEGFKGDKCGIYPGNTSLSFKWHLISTNRIL